MYLLIVFCDVAPLVAVRILAVLLAQTFTGGEIYRYFKQSAQMSLVEFAAVGFSLGALTWLIADQIFIALALPKIGWVIPLVLALIRKLYKLRGSSSQLTVDWIALRWILIAGLLGLSGEWVWTLPLALVLVVVAYISDVEIESVSKKVKVVVIAIVVLGAGLLTLITRPKVWWISQSDTHFYEGLTKSVAKWGWQESIFSSGFSLQYHWFPYAWSGLVTRISGSPDWVVLTRVGVLIPTLCLISYIWIISTRLSVNKKAPIVGVLLFCASSIFGEWFVSIPLAMFGSFSQLFATIWLMPVLLWAIDVCSGTFKRSWLYLTLIFVGLVGGKVSHAAIGAAFIFSFQVARVVKDRNYLRPAIFEGFVVLSVLFITSRVLFGSGGSLSPRPAAWAPYLQGDLYLFYGRSLWIAAAILLLGMTYLALSTLIFGSSVLRNAPQIYFALSIAMISGIAFSNFSSGPTSPNGLFFLHAAVILVNSVLGVVVTDFSKSFARLRKSGVVFSSAVGVVSLLAIYLIPNRDSGANIAIWMRAFRSLVILIPVVVFCGVFLLARRRESFSKVSLQILTAQIAITLVTFVATNGSSYLGDMSGFKKNSGVFLASKDLEQLRDWLKSNSTEDAVYASNYVCEGTDCTEPQLSQRALLSTTIELKALVEAPWIASAFTEPRLRNGAGDFVERLTFSAKFAQAPTQKSLDFFNRSNVRWYIVDLERTNNGDWLESPALVFSNSSFIVLDLEKFEL